MKIYQACKAGKGIIGHRGIRIFCLYVVCLSVIKLLPAYGIDHYQNSYLGSLGHCEDQSRFDIDCSPIPRPPNDPQKWAPKMESFIFDVLTWNFVHILPDSCHIVNHDLNLKYKVCNCACAGLSLLVLYGSGLYQFEIFVDNLLTLAAL